MTSDNILRTAQAAWLNFYGSARNNPVLMLTPFVYPVSLLFIMYLYSGAKYLPFLLAGAFVYQSIEAGVTVFSEVASSKLYFNIQELFVGSPTSPVVYAGAIGLGWLLNNGPAAIFYMALAIWASGASLLAIPGLLLLLILLCAILTGLSFYAANLMEGEKDVYTIGSLFTFVVFLLSPVYYPITSMPVFLQPLSFIFPATGAAVLAQGMLGILDVSGWLLWLSIANIVVYLGISYALVKRAKWRED